MKFNDQHRYSVVTLSPLLPLRFAQGFGSLKGKLREGSLSMGSEVLPLRCAQGCGSLAQHDSTDPEYENSKSAVAAINSRPTHLEFDTPDPDRLYQQLKTAGMPVEAPPSLKPWGEYDFTIHDPDGNCLEFDSPRHQLSSWGNRPG